MLSIRLMNIVRLTLTQSSDKPLLFISPVFATSASECFSRGFRTDGDPESTVPIIDLPKDYKGVELPEKRKLPQLERVPNFPGIQKTPYSQKKLSDIRGPEFVHNKLIYKQYGIIALSGTQFRIGHIEAIRLTVNKMIDDNKMFAAWRIDPPWKPRTKKGIGKTMGGGKGSIDHYVSPIKAGRVIIEMGGKVEFTQIQPILQQVVFKLPCDALIVSQEDLEKLYQEEGELQRKNINPFSFEYVVNNNMQGCQKWITKYDLEFYNKYI